MFNETATTVFYTYSHTLSLHDALPISGSQTNVADMYWRSFSPFPTVVNSNHLNTFTTNRGMEDRKSTRLNSSHYCAASMPYSACHKTDNYARRRPLTPCHKQRKQETCRTAHKDTKIQPMKQTNH